MTAKMRAGVYGSVLLFTVVIFILSWIDLDKTKASLPMIGLAVAAVAPVLSLLNLTPDWVREVTKQTNGAVPDVVTVDTTTLEPKAPAVVTIGQDIVSVADSSQEHIEYEDSALGSH